MPHIATARSVTDLVRTLRLLGYRRADDTERRREPRYAVSLPVEIEPLDADLQPSGRRRQAVTRDLSENGIGLFCESPVPSPYLRIWLPAGPGERLPVVVEVTRCEPAAFLFNVGGRLLTDPAPAAADPQPLATTGA